MITTAPRPLDRLWARLRPKLTLCLSKIKRQHTARKSRPRATSEDMAKLHEHFRREST